MLNPIEKPTAAELRAAEIVFQSVDDTKRVIRAVIKAYGYVVGAPKRSEAIKRGDCIRLDRVIEMHIPRDGGPVTWWAVYESNPKLAL